MTGSRTLLFPVFDCSIANCAIMGTSAEVSMLVFLPFEKEWFENKKKSTSPVAEAGTAHTLAQGNTLIGLFNDVCVPATCTRPFHRHFLSQHICPTHELRKVPRPNHLTSVVNILSSFH